MQFPAVLQDLTREKQDETMNAGLAQLVEQLICNHQVVSSSLTSGSIINRLVTILKRFFIVLDSG